MFHEDSTEINWTFKLEGADRVVLRSSKAGDEVRVSRIAGDAVAVRGRMLFSIVGYHGTKEAAGVGGVPRAAMQIRDRRHDGVLTLSSGEFSYIHHSALFTTLELDVPAGVSVEVAPYSLAELNANARAHP